MRISVIDNSSSKIWKSYPADKQPLSDIHTYIWYITRQMLWCVLSLETRSFLFSFLLDFFSFFLRLGLILIPMRFSPNVVVFSWESSVIYTSYSWQKWIDRIERFSLSLIPTIYVISLSFLSPNYFISEVMCVTLPVCYSVTSFKKKT